MFVTSHVTESCFKVTIRLVNPYYTFNTKCINSMKYPCAAPQFPASLALRLRWAFVQKPMDVSKVMKATTRPGFRNNIPLDLLILSFLISYVCFEKKIYCKT